MSFARQSELDKPGRFQAQEVLRDMAARMSSYKEVCVKFVPKSGHRRCHPREGLGEFILDPIFLEVRKAHGDVSEAKISRRGRGRR